MIINIVGGSGVIGQLHKKIFEKYGHVVIVSGRKSSPSMQECAQKSDITIISVPIDATEKIIQKVAPFCKAICDFTSLKKFPVDAMLKYSKNDCEVMGIHPLYGDVESIKDRTVISCKTDRTGKNCIELIKCFEKEGAKVIEMNAEEHDKKVSSINQALRVKILTAFLKTIKDEEKIFSKEYDLSPPPTKTIIEIISRQLNKSNDDMYLELLNKDNFSEEIEDKFIKNFKKVKKNYKKEAEEIRNYLGNDIKILQEKAKNKIK